MKDHNGTLLKNYGYVLICFLSQAFKNIQSLNKTANPILREVAPREKKMQISMRNLSLEKKNFF
jgi:hypothetical protein